MNRPPAPPNVLLVHDGELHDVRGLLQSLRVSLCERLEGRLRDGDHDARWDLVVGSPKRIIHLQLDPCNARTIQIAIVSHDSRTLRTSLRRAGIQLIVRRPVHPATLRALMVHALYRGPEKRQSARVNVGAPIRLKVGWRLRPAILMDLSVGGCRLVTDRRIDRGRTLRVQVPAEYAGGRELTLQARVLASVPDGDVKRSRAITTARFEEVTPAAHDQLAALIAAYLRGPAIFPGTTREPAPAPSSPPASPARGIEPRERPPAERVRIPAAAIRRPRSAPPAPAATPAPPAAPSPFAPLGPGEELTAPDFAWCADPRAAAAARACALGAEAKRVLLGRDLTIGGMRVDPNPSLELGAGFQLAVHAGNREKPLVVRAVVARDDGERGLVLRFRGLSIEGIRTLIEIMDELPLVDIDRGGRRGLVAEIVSAERAPGD